MALSRDYQRLAQQFGVTQGPGQTDEDFMNWLEGLRSHRKLLAQARALDVEITFGITSKEIRELILAHYETELRQRGFVLITYHPVVG